MTKARRNAARGRQDEASTAIAAYMDRNDREPLLALVWASNLPKKVREFLRDIISHELRRRRGAPCKPRCGSPWPTIKALVALMNNKGLKRTAAKRELARSGKYGSERTIDRALQRGKAERGGKPVIGVANKSQD